MSQSRAGHVDNGGIRGFFIGLAISLSVGAAVALIVFLLTDVSGHGVSS